jgi:hypothetical protein
MTRIYFKINLKVKDLNMFAFRMNLFKFKFNLLKCFISININKDLKFEDDN